MGTSADLPAVTDWLVTGRRSSMPVLRESENPELRYRPPALQLLEGVGRLVASDEDPKTLASVVPGSLSDPARPGAAPSAVGHGIPWERDRVADALLVAAAPLVRRRLLLAVVKQHLVGWMTDGSVANSHRLERLRFPVGRSPVLASITQEAVYWRGALPSSPSHDQILEVLGGTAPRDSLLMPIRVGVRSVAFFYGDNESASVESVSIASLQALISLAAQSLGALLVRKHEERLTG